MRIFHRYILFVEPVVSTVPFSYPGSLAQFGSCHRHWLLLWSPHPLISLATQLASHWFRPVTVKKCKAVFRGIILGDIKMHKWSLPKRTVIFSYMVTIDPHHPYAKRDIFKLWQDDFLRIPSLLAVIDIFLFLRWYFRQLFEIFCGDLSVFIFLIIALRCYWKLLIPKFN